jgi:uncharacterized protein HemX
MSSLYDPARRETQRRPLPAGARSSPLTVVVPGASRRAARVPFVLVVVLALALGVVGLLLVNTSLQQGAFRLAALQTQAADLLARQQGLELAVEAQRDPQRVAARAQRLGMVPNPNPAFLRLSDGRVLGVPRPAVAGSGPRVEAPQGVVGE